MVNDEIDAARNIEIIKLCPDDWRVVRDLRLEALRDEPKAWSQGLKGGEATDETAWRPLLSSRESLFMFARDSGQLVGMACAYTDNADKKKHIRNLAHVYVNPKYRNLGVGKQIINGLMSELTKDSKVVKIKLQVSTILKSAISLYKALGFRTVGILEKEILNDGEYVDQLVMEKILRN